jgi:hypothetical protein
MQVTERTGYNILRPTLLLDKDPPIHLEGYNFSPQNRGKITALLRQMQMESFTFGHLVCTSFLIVPLGSLVAFLDPWLKMMRCLPYC